ncbi:MAG: hypothetical protein HDR83_01655 [Bacteroides sp.]|nr:hypothetical protein [Bacteroides sp.]
MKHIYSFLLLSCAAVAVSAAPMSRHFQIKKGVKRQVVETPVTLPATDITSEGFTANWNKVAVAETYSVLVYEPSVATTAGDYTILHETFDLVSEGTTVEPYFPDDATVELSDYDWTFTPDWQGYWPVFAQGKVSGIIYSPYTDLVNDGGKFTVTIEVEGWSGAQVVLKSSGETDETVTFDLTHDGINTFTHTFTNGCHDTFLTYTDNGILNDPEGAYTDKYDFLDEITITQNLKPGDQILRLVATAETGNTSKSFLTLPYRYGATNLAYDVQANKVTFGPDYPEDWYDYEVEYSPYSSLEYVTLLDGENPKDPDQPGTGVDDDDDTFPVADGNKLYVGNYLEPTTQDIEEGTWWIRAPYQWYTRYSASQIIYTAEMLKGLKAGDLITEIAFKYEDQGAFAHLSADLRLVAQNSDATQFDPKPDTNKYPWIEYNSADASLVEYEAFLYSMETEEIVIPLATPLVYDGKSIVLTCWSESFGDEIQSVASIVNYCDTRNTQVYGSDTQTFETIYETGYNQDYMTPEKFVPVARFTFNRTSGIGSVTVGENEAADAVYYDLQGRRVANPAAGFYIRRTAEGAEKVLVK